MIVGLTPTYREGPLAAAAVRCLLECCDVVYACEGPAGPPHTDGSETVWPKDLIRESRVSFTHGEWSSDAAKRNAMLERTRRYPAPVWGVYLDADEILIGARWLPDLIHAHDVNTPDGEDAAAIDLLITEVDGSVGRVHRVFRLDRLEAHLLSMSQLKFRGLESVVTFPLIPVWRPGEEVTAFNRPPLQGEPHIHHRAYYRPPARAEHRLHQAEIDEFRRLEQAEATRLGLPPSPVGGAFPVHQDPGFIVAREIERK
jgi:hypothetical protein